MKRASKKRSKSWDTFLRIPSPQTTDRVAAIDGDWLAARGVYPGAPVVIQQLRDDVLPLIRKLRESARLAWYFFLIHDRTSGVPAPTDDAGSYIHLRLVFWWPVSSARITDLLPKKWEMTRPVEDGDAIGGLDGNLLRDGIDDARELIGRQSEWVLRLIDEHKSDADPLALILRIRQYLHYFANMLQIKVVG